MPPSNPLPTSQVAAQFTPPSPAQIYMNQTAKVPQLPKSGTATLVKVEYASLNPVEYKIGSMPFGLARLILGGGPITPGTDYVGRVWATTPNSRFKGGDLVWGSGTPPTSQGTCAQFTVIHGSDRIAKIPEGYNRDLSELGAVGIAGFTALQALNSATNLPFVTSNGQERGGNVFINGSSGGVGTFMVQIAKHGMGLDNVVASCSGANADFVRSLGADEVIDYRSTKVMDGLKQWSRKNGGQKFDVIIDNVGNDHSIYWEASSYLKEGGKYIQIGGGASIGEVISLVKILGWPAFLGGSRTPFQFLLVKSYTEQQYDMLGRWLAEGKVGTVIEDENRFDLTEVGKAIEKLQGNRTRGKVVIKVAQDDDR